HQCPIGAGGRCRARRGGPCRLRRGRCPAGRVANERAFKRKSGSAMKKVHVKVPATSANLGPGFDVLGVALPLYNEVSMAINGGAWTASRRAISLTIDIEGEGFDSLPRDESNLVAR